MSRKEKNNFRSNSDFSLACIINQRPTTAEIFIWHSSLTILRPSKSAIDAAYFLFEGRIRFCITCLFVMLSFMTRKKKETTKHKKLLSNPGCTNKSLMN